MLHKTINSVCKHSGKLFVFQKSTNQKISNDNAINIRLIILQTDQLKKMVEWQDGMWRDGNLSTCIKAHT